MLIDWLDLAVILVYLLAVTLFGMRFRSGDRSLKTYFLGSETVPWWAISLSIVAAETSTLTLISVPGIAYQGDFSFLQLVMGYVLGRFIISALLLPRYFQKNIYTAYEWIRNRFGVRLQRMTAGVFLLTRASAEGVRVYAVSMVIAAVFGFSGIQTPISVDALAIGTVILLTLFYTYHGGLNAVIWTDVLQIGIYTTGTLVGLVSLIHGLPEGWSSFFHVAEAHGKFKVFQLHWDLTKPYTLYAGIIGGAFLTTASHGTDQLLVQRLLAAHSEKKARWALISSGFFVFFQFSFYLTIGAALFVYHLIYNPLKTWARSDQIFPDFIVHHMPLGVRGLLLAAILAAAMSNLSAALNSLASTTVMDFYRVWFPKKTDHQRILFSRRATLFWALVLFGLALLSRQGGRVIETGLAIASLAYGSLLGVFLIGSLSERTREKAAIAGMCSGLVINLTVWKFTSIAFTWYVPIGAVSTAVIAAVLNGVLSEKT
jgi:SSS family transporter